MNEITKEKVMSLREIADLFEVSGETILRKVKKFFPDLVQNGKTTYLNQLQITIIKKDLEKNYSINLHTGVELPKTNLEKQLLIRQAMQISNELIEELQKENDSLKGKIQIDKPKIECFDTFIEISDLHDIGTTAKLLNIGRNKLFALLRKKTIFMTNNQPFQEYIDRGYFKTKIKPFEKLNKNTVVSFATPKGIEFIRGLL